MELLNNEDLKRLNELRKWLHQNPELSGQEINTSRKIEEFVQTTQPARIITGIGGYGIAAVFHFNDHGPTVLARADMDALPIDEINTFSHKSAIEGISHKCGHDGHSAILAGLGIALHNKPFSSGRVILLFQPEEETGMGAAKVIADDTFKMFIPDYVIALHNLPGYPLNSLVIKEGPFAAASTGMIIKIKGKSSHAAYPEQGNSPAEMMARAILQLKEIPDVKSEKFRDFALITIIHAKLGNVAFGTNPGNAIVMATLRTFYNDDMKILKKEAETVCRIIAEEHNLIIDISWTEEFPATFNDQQVTDIIRQVGDELGETIIEIDQPFRWSEDFGHFTQRFKGALFGIGSGEESPGLHNPDYDFPDEIIPSGVHFFYKAIEKLLLLKENKS
jgi:amidohydrolase